jgi:hypothetical protein
MERDARAAVSAMVVEAVEVFVYIWEDNEAEMTN